MTFKNILECLGHHGESIHYNQYSCHQHKQIQCYWECTLEITKYVFMDHLQSMKFPTLGLLRDYYLNEQKCFEETLCYFLSYWNFLRLTTFNNFFFFHYSESHYSLRILVSHKVVISLSHALHWKLKLLFVPYVYYSLVTASSLYFLCFCASMWQESFSLL